MLDYLIMGIILLFLAFELLFGAKLKPVNEHFFDKKNTQALRGFWCLVIPMVHLPEMYQNRIQDMIGSFAYIGVTFFFMTSSYGLTLSSDSKPFDLWLFWRKRLPKLLIVSLIINLIFAFLNHTLFGKHIGVLNIIELNEWVIWLIACYFAFWLSNIIFTDGKKWKIATYVMIIAGSLIIYFLSKKGIITFTTWTTEIYGFVWGIILATYRDLFLKLSSQRWKVFLSISIICSALLGVCYLKCKYIPFAGDYLLKIILGVAITAFMLIANTRIELGNKVSMFLGRISFEIYLVHFEVIDLLRDIKEWDSSGVYILSCVVLTFVCAALLHLMTDRLLLKLSGLFNYQ